MRKKMLQITIIFLVAFIGVISILLLQNTPYTLTSSTNTLWSSNWSVNKELIDLHGQQINTPLGQPVILSKRLPTDNLTHQHVLLRGSLSDVSVYIEKEQIYQTDRCKYLPFSVPPASLWHIIPLSNNYAGKKMTIEINSPYSRMHGLLNPVHLGNKGDLMFYILENYSRAFWIDLVILLIGLLLMIIAFVNPRKINNSIWLIGLFSVFVSLWLIAESRMMQFFIGDHFINASLAYIALAIIPIPMLQYVKRILSKRHHRILNYQMLLSYLVLLIICLFQFANISDFFNTVILTHSVIVLDIITITYYLFSDYRRNKSVPAQHLIFSMGILFVFILIDVIRFQVFNVADVTVFTRIGLLVFILMLGFEVLRQLVTQVEKSYKAEFYESLAYHDSLTQGHNRTAFEEDLEELFKWHLDLKQLRLVILDMNDLKKINDTYGHVTGDEAIKNAYWIIHDSFSNYGKTYRIGGDEFAVIIKNSNESDFFESSVNLYDSVVEFNNKVNYPFSIAFGSVVYDPSLDLTAEKMIHRADTNMYFEKNRRYKQGKIASL